jgi:hypothetical protein
LDNLAAKLTHIAAQQQKRIVIVDSLNSVMYALRSMDSGPAGMKGMVAAYPTYLLALSQWALNQQMCIIGTLNIDLFTTGKLTGAIEGEITITSQTALRMADRTNREGSIVRIPSKYRNNADRLLGRSEKSKNIKVSGMRAF